MAEDEGVVRTLRSRVKELEAEVEEYKKRERRRAQVGHWATSAAWWLSLRAAGGAKIRESLERLIHSAQSSEVQPSHIAAVGEAIIERLFHVGWARLGVIGLAAIVGAIPAVVTALLLQQQIEEQAAANVLLAEQTRAATSSTRPWVGLDEEGEPIRVSSLKFDEGGTAWMEAEVTAKNYGSYPAQNVFSDVELMLVQRVDAVENKMRALCFSPIPERNIGEVLFPGHTGNIWKWGRSRVSPGQRVRVPGNDSDKFLAYLVGCVMYRDQFGVDHHTGFTFRLQVPGSVDGLVIDFSKPEALEGNWVKRGGFVD